MKSLSWQAVTLGLGGMALFGGLFYLADTTGRSALLGVVTAVGTTVTTIAVTRARQEARRDIESVREELSLVKDHVNGNTRRLIDKIPDADRPTDIPQL